jgi:hypothetical protein
MLIEMEGESENLVFGVDPLDHHVRATRPYGLQIVAIAYFKGKFEIGVSKFHTGRLGVCVSPNRNPRSELDMRAVLQRVNVVAPKSHQVRTLQEVLQVC